MLFCELGDVDVLTTERKLVDAIPDLCWKVEKPEWCVGAAIARLKSVLCATCQMKLRRHSRRLHAVSAVGIAGGHRGWRVVRWTKYVCAGVLRRKGGRNVSELAACQALGLGIHMTETLKSLICCPYI